MAEEYDETDYGAYEAQQYEDYGDQTANYYAPTEAYEEFPLPQVKSHEEILQTAPRPEGHQKLGEFDDENLGEDFEETPWLPPSIEKAVEFRSKEVFRGGSASTCGTKVCTAPDLGVGTALYFQFVKSMAVCFFVMFILSIPSMVFCYFGKKIPTIEAGKVEMYRFMIGNIGYDPASLTYNEDAACTGKLSKLNETCLHFPHSQITMTQASGIITGFEFLQIVVFFCVVYHLQRRAFALKDEVDKLNTSVTDYTVMVRNIPPDTSVEQLVAHFSNLYGLDKPDWKQRPQLIGARPVQPISKTGFAGPYHLNTWVAECTISRKIGRQLSAFLAQQELSKQLRMHRATMKMYAENTPHGGGPNPRKYERAEKQMIATGAAIELLAEKVIDKKQIHHANTDGADLKFGQNKDANSAIEADAVAAFVTFEYSESYARCVEDYSKYLRFPRSLCTPSALRFHGTNIKVTPAPEPDSVVWENLEVPWGAKRLRRARTTCVGILLLILGFFIILRASIAKTEEAKLIPPIGMCDGDIPALFNITKAQHASVKLTRPATAAKKKEYDNLCNNVVPNSFYAIYTNKFNVPMANYSWEVCASIQDGLCPSQTQRVHCPCITTSNSNSRRESCTTLPCSVNPTSSFCGTSFHPSLLGGCLCKLELETTLLDAKKVALSAGKALDIDPQCQSFALSYSKSTGFTYGATFLTVVINYILGVAVEMLTKTEAHSSLGKQQASLAIKLFVCTFFNMALLVLLAFGRPPQIQSDFVQKTLHIFDGIYPDFNPDWYPDVGNFLVVTFGIQVISPWVTPLIDYYVSSPLVRCMNYPMISMQRSHKVVMQDQLNELEVGPVFDTSSNLAQALSLLFFAMLYAPGIPLLMFIAWLAFTINFMLQKMLICRYYRRPPHVDDGVIRAVLGILPLAAVFRLCFAIWMFGNPIIFPVADGSFTNMGGSVSTSAVTNTASKHGVKGASSYGGKVSTSQAQSQLNYQNQLGGEGQSIGAMFGRVYNPNVYPLFVLLLVVVALLILRRIWKFLPLYWLMRFVNGVRKSCCSKERKIYSTDEAHAGGAVVHPFELHKLDDSLRQEMAPYSGEYFQYVKDKDEIPTSCLRICCYDNETSLLPAEVEAGWVMIEDDHFICRKQIWLHNSTSGGCTRVKGDFKRTYEVINDHAINSYNLEKIPQYRHAVLALKEGAAGIAENALDDKKKKESFGDKYSAKKHGHQSDSDKAHQQGGNAWDVEKGAPKSQAMAGRGGTPKGGAKPVAAAWQPLNNNDEDDDDDDDDDDEE